MTGARKTSGGPKLSTSGPGVSPHSSVGLRHSSLSLSCTFLMLEGVDGIFTGLHKVILESYGPRPKYLRLTWMSVKY